MVTLESIYGELLSVHEDVTVTKVHMETVTETSKDHGRRIASLEGSRWPLPSLSILISIGVLALSFFGK